MMMGETDGLNSFIIPFQTSKLHFGKTSLIFLALFIFLIQILLTNLLVRSKALILGFDLKFLDWLGRRRHRVGSKRC